MFSYFTVRHTAAVLLLAIGWQVVLPYARDLWFGPSPSQAGAAEPAPRVSTLPIGQVQPGMRLRGQNPRAEEIDRAAEPDPDTSRLIVLRMTKPSGYALDIQLIRSFDWMAEHGATEVGDTIEFAREELNAKGRATLLEIRPCPQFHDGAGNLVTGKYVHELPAGSPVLNVTLANGDRLTGVTPNHPIWSVDAQEFVAIGDLAAGARVVANGAETTLLTSTSRPARPSPRTRRSALPRLGSRCSSTLGASRGA